MPINTSISSDAQLVFAIAHGKVTRDEMYQYLKDTWVKQGTTGFNCVFDATSADFSGLNNGDLAKFAESVIEIDEDIKGARLAIIIANKHEEQLANFYKASREQTSSHKRETLICRSMREAMDWVMHA